MRPLPLLLAMACLAPVLAPSTHAAGDVAWSGQVPATGQAVTITLPAGSYVITALGTYRYGSFEYEYADASRSWTTGSSCNDWPGNGLDLLVNGQSPWGPDCHLDHVYSTPWACPASCVLTFNINEGWVADNAGSLDVVVEHEGAILLAQNVPVTPETPLPPGGAPVVGTLSTYDDGARLCVDVTLGDQPRTNVACVNAAALGPAGPLVPRGDTPIAPEGLVVAPGTHVSVIVGYRVDAQLLVEEASVLDGAARVVAPFDPADPQAFLDRPEQTALFARVVVAAGAGRADTGVVLVPYVGQVMGAATGGD